MLQTDEEKIALGKVVYPQGSDIPRRARLRSSFDFYSTENDPDYFNAQEERFRLHCSQQGLFTVETPVVEEQQVGLF